MSLVSVTESSLENIAAAIRNKKGGTDTYTPGQMAGAINGIHTADEVVLVQKSITANGTYNPAGDSADGYSNVSVDVANSYTSADNGKVVSNQQLVAQTSKNINANGTHDTTANNSVVVDVPNSYVAADEGKVVSGGALVEQTSRNVTMNGTYDTTENNEVVVNVSGGTLIQKTITQNGTYNASDDDADGYSSVTVNVSGGGTTRVELMHQGQVSTTSAYATANFDSSIDFTQYNCLIFELYRDGVKVGSSAIGNGDYEYKPDGNDFRITSSAYNYTMKFAKNSKTIKCASYSGKYVDLYVDVYGVAI